VKFVILFFVLLSTSPSLASEAQEQRVVKRYYQMRQKPLSFLKLYSISQPKEDIEKFRHVIKTFKIKELPLISWDGEEYILQESQSAPKNKLRPIDVASGRWQWNGKTLDISQSQTGWQQYQTILKVISQPQMEVRSPFQIFPAAYADVSDAVEAALKDSQGRQAKFGNLLNALGVQTVSKVAKDENTRFLASTVDGVARIECASQTGVTDVNKDLKVLFAKMDLEQGTPEEVIVFSQKGTETRLSDILIPTDNGEYLSFSISFDEKEIESVQRGELILANPGPFQFKSRFFLRANTNASTLDPLFHGGAKAVKEKKSALDQIARIKSQLPKIREIQAKCWDETKLKSGKGWWPFGAK